MGTVDSEYLVLDAVPSADSKFLARIPRTDLIVTYLVVEYEMLVILKSID